MIKVSHIFACSILFRDLARLGVVFEQVKNN